MSVRTLSRVWEHSKVRGTLLLLLLAIADFADDLGFAWPSIPTLAAKARISVRTIQRLLRRLVQAGELLIEPGEGRVKTAGGLQRTHRFRVLAGLQAGAKVSPPPRDRGGDIRRKGGAIQVQGGDVAVSPEPSFDPSLKPSLGIQTSSHEGNGKGQMTAREAREKIARFVNRTARAKAMKP